VRVCEEKNTINAATIPSNSPRIDFKIPNNTKMQRYQHKKVCERNLSLRQHNANHKTALIEAASTLINHNYPQYQLNTIKTA